MHLDKQAAFSLKFGHAAAGQQQQLGIMWVIGAYAGVCVP